MPAVSSRRRTTVTVVASSLASFAGLACCWPREQVAGKVGVALVLSVAMEPALLSMTVKPPLRVRVRGKGCWWWLIHAPGVPGRSGSRRHGATGTTILVPA
jgi:hypothetical protein